MVDWIVGEVNGTDIVAEDDARIVHVDMELTKEIPQPAALGRGIGHTAVFSLCGGARNNTLVF
jgi:hypothetical protein